ncbi:MAG: hypothetical protein RLN62_06565 [Rickettsiales bacterium]
MAAETRTIYTCTSSKEIDSVLTTLTTEDDGTTVALSDLDTAYYACLDTVISISGDYYLSLTNADSGCQLYPGDAVAQLCVMFVSGGSQFSINDIDIDS